MRIAQAKLTQNYQLTIPTEVRRQLQLNAGDLVYLALDGGQVVLRRVAQSWTEHYRGLGAEIWSQERGGIQNLDHIPDP